ncbi:MAG TPA: hypothetical protein VJZ92_00875 [Thermodesulfobacteriota bacterium]|nr:hypothetical protein [Thermodesulfobacteriota bacterium]
MASNKAPLYTKKLLAVEKAIFSGFFMHSQHRCDSHSCETKGLPQQMQIGPVIRLTLSRHLWQNLPSRASLLHRGHIGGRSRFKNGFNMSA